MFRIAAFDPLDATSRRLGEEVRDVIAAGATGSTST